MRPPRRYWSTNVYVNPDPPLAEKTQQEKDAEWLATQPVLAPPKIICVECGAGMLRDHVAMFKNNGLWYCEKHHVLA